MDWVKYDIELDDCTKAFEEAEKERIKRKQKILKKRRLKERIVCISCFSILILSLVCLCFLYFIVDEIKTL